MVSIISSGANTYQVGTRCAVLRYSSQEINRSIQTNCYGINVQRALTIFEKHGSMIAITSRC